MSALFLALGASAVVSFLVTHLHFPPTASNATVEEGRGDVWKLGHGRSCL
ncbi:hypothetical protein [Pyrobaculum sp.]